MKIAILGASNKPDQDSYQAFHHLREDGHEVFPVHPTLQEIDGCRVYPSLTFLAGAVDTISIHVPASSSSQLANDIIGMGVRRVIFNPGAENPDLERELADRGVEVVEGCMLVLMESGRI